MILASMSKSLGLPIPIIRALANKASHAYKTYTIPKRNGGSRIIHHPSKELKALQRWLLYNIINAWPIHRSAVAYKRGISIKDNAQKHVTSRYLLRMDIKDFFPSITSVDVMAYLRDSVTAKTWPEDEQRLFISIVCREGKLTIGAPTSPALSNALCFQLDRQLEAWCQLNDITYTRYADDLFFSTCAPNILKTIPDILKDLLRQLKYPSGLVINETKTRHSSKGGRRQITGLVLKCDNSVGIGRTRKRYIRSLINNYATLGESDKKKLAGLIAFALSVEPDFINALTVKYGHVRMVDARGMNPPEDSA